MNRRGGLLDTDRKPWRFSNGQTFSRKPHLVEKAKPGERNPPFRQIFILENSLCEGVKGGKGSAPAGRRTADTISLSSRRNAIYITPSRPAILQLYANSRAPNRKRERERSSGKGKKKTTLQEFLILMGKKGGAQKRRATQSGNSFYHSQANKRGIIFALLVVAFSHFFETPKCNALLVKKCSFWNPVKY